MVFERKRLLTSLGGMVWGQLTPMNIENTVVLLHGTTFTIGEGYDFNLCIGDPKLDLLWCVIESEECDIEGELIVNLEKGGCNRVVTVNGEPILEYCRTRLSSGDEVIFDTSMPQLKAPAAPIFNVIAFEDITVSFDQFPLNDTTKWLLVKSSYIHLMKKEFAKFTLRLPLLSPRILLSGPGGSEVYQETLVKALTQYFKGNLFVVSTPSSRSSILVAIDHLFEVAQLESQSKPVIVFLKNIEHMVMFDTYIAFKRNLESLPKNMVAVASCTQPKKDEDEAVSMKLVNGLFPNKVTIQGDETLLKEWKQQLELDGEIKTSQSNLASISSALSRNGIHCPDIDALCIKDQTLSSENVEKIIGWALCHHFMHGSAATFKDEQIVISSASIRHGLEFLKDIQDENKSLKISLKDVSTDNDFEEDLLGKVIPPGDIGVTFDDIGALDNVKETLKELVMLPLQRPELFSKGQLIKPCKGILLFGPPGTGKTMLAKAVATEANANFLNVSISDITSKWFGEGEKYVKAVFTLAKKLSPSDIFVDEVDAMLGRRSSSREHEAMRKMKNEFMVNWDGLCTKDKERVLVLAATNRPFDLDEAVIRRLSRRLMVGLPYAPNREKIIKVILASEELGPD